LINIYYILKKTKPMKPMRNPSHSGANLIWLGIFQDLKGCVEKPELGIGDLE
jgi:hypothetical protein